MAITLADFTKIWASTSPLTPYTFSDANYKQGWNFIGDTPPARQMWDSIQKQNDEKMKYIVDNFLPLDGGTMTGAIVLADGGNPLSTAGGTMVGAIVGNPLTLTADDGNGNTVSLVENPNGSLTLNGKEVERVNASGEGYIRYESGLQLCWGVDGLTEQKTYTFAVPFANSPSIVSGINYLGGSTSIGGLSETGFTAYMSSYNHAFRWIAIGFWK